MDMTRNGGKATGGMPADSLKPYMALAFQLPQLIPGFFANNTSLTLSETQEVPPPSLSVSTGWAHSGRERADYLRGVPWWLRKQQRSMLVPRQRSRHFAF